MQNITVNYKNNVTCPPLAFTALFLFHRNLPLNSEKPFFHINHVSFDLDMLKGTRTAFEQQVSMSVWNDYCHKTAFATKQLYMPGSCFQKDLNKSVEHF